MMKSKSSILFLSLLLLCLISIGIPTFADSNHANQKWAEKTQPESSSIPVDNSPGYTINFDNVPIVEYIRFISKIGGINFIYDEQNLDFNVTIISEEPTKLVNVIAALVQILRINGLNLIEEGNNLVITKTGAVRQIATVVSQEVPLEGPSIPPIMTRVFRIKNANPMSLAGLVRPMLSDDAIIEVSEESRHLIITDITHNIEQIHKLFLSLDVPKAALDTETYTARNNPPETLITLATQVLTPISEGNPLIFVPQDSTNTIFIVSTPFLIEKAIAILDDLDNPPSLAKRFGGPVTGKNILIYKIMNKPAEALENGVKQIESNLIAMGPSASQLAETLGSMKYIRESHSLLFTGNPESLSEVNAILKDLDTPYTEQELEFVKGGFFIYKIKYGDEEQIAHALQKLVENLKATSFPDQDLIKTIESMKWVKENDSLIFTGDQRSVEKLKKILPTFDVPLDQGKSASKVPLSSDFYTYTPVSESPEELLKKVQELYKSLKEGNLSDPAFLYALNSAKIVPSSHSIIFTGDPASLNRIRAVVALMDQPQGPPSQQMFVYVYKIKHVQPGYIEETLIKLGKSVPPEDPLAQTIDNMKYIPQSGTLIFRGPQATIDHIKLILPTIDNIDTEKEIEQTKSTYFVYQLKNASGQDVLKELEQTLKTINNSNEDSQELSEAIHNIKWIESTNSLILTGPPPIINHLKTMIASFDIPRMQKPKASEFFVYKPTGISAEEFQERVSEAANEMDSAGLTDSDLIKAMESGTLVSNNSAVMFTGTPNGIEKLKKIIQTFDTYQKGQPKSSEFFLYKPKSISAEQLKKDILQAASQLQKSNLDDPELLAALNSVKAEPEKDRVLFTGTPEAIQKIKVMVKIYDSHEAAAKTSEYFIYTPKNQTPDSIIKQAQHTAEEMEDSGFAEPSLIKALESATIVSNGSAVLFTGTAKNIDEIKNIAPTFDTKGGPQATEFFVYKPTHISAELLKEHSNKVAQDMETNGFADPSVIHTLLNARLVSNGKGVLFTGTPDSLKKVRVLLPSLDSPTEKTIGKTVFIIYKIKNVPGPTLMGYLRNMANDLNQAGSRDEDLIKTLNNMRYVKDTNSIVFTGTSIAVNEAITLAEKFDIPELGQDGPARAPADFVIYKPKYLPGDELIKILHDFEQNLLNSGVDNKGLFDAINNLKWMERTSSILISGDDDDTSRVLDLLKRFDIPGPGIPEGETGIETVSDMSFLIYKLQYHSGSDIQDAIKKIGLDLGKVKGSTNTDLVDAIQTLQWIEITNSIIATGKADALGKLKELVKSIDVPLKQVFVEVLVIETTIGNQLSFGLRWGTQGNYRNKFSYGTYSTPSNFEDNTDPLAPFNSALQSITATNTPTGQFIPVSSGFDLGVIGDIVLHKGQTYLALGSLVDAIRTDGDSTIVMNQKVITQDNKMSTIFIGQNIPYTGSFVSNSGTNTVETSNLEYRDVGVSLSITPTVGNNDIITLEIEEDISEVINTNQGNDVGTDNVSGITTSKTTTKTVASVPDKSFLVLSGSIQDSTTHNRTGIPCLGGLPLVGAAFSNTDTSYNTNNIIIFVRPQIIKSYDTYSEITERQESIFRNQANEEDFDAGLELVKTPDDTY